MFPLPMFRSYTSGPTVPYMYSYVPFLAQRLSKNRMFFIGIQSYLSIFTLPQSVDSVKSLYAVESEEIL
jgi:hypothetical protein